MTECGDMKLMIPDGIELWYDGSKNYWRARTSLDILLVHHIAEDVLELVLFDQTNKVELPRKYIDGPTLFARVERDDLQDAYKVRKEINDREHMNTDPQHMFDKLMRELIIQHVLSRIEVIPPCSHVVHRALVLYNEYLPGEERHESEKGTSYMLNKPGVIPIKFPRAKKQTSHRELAPIIEHPRPLSGMKFIAELQAKCSKAGEALASGTRWKTAYQQVRSQIEVEKIRGRLKRDKVQTLVSMRGQNHQRYQSKQTDHGMEKLDVLNVQGITAVPISHCLDQVECLLFARVASKGTDSRTDDSIDRESHLHPGIDILNRDRISISGSVRSELNQSIDNDSCHLPRDFCRVADNETLFRQISRITSKAGDGGVHKSLVVEIPSAIIAVDRIDDDAAVEASVAGTAPVADTDTATDTAADAAAISPRGLRKRERMSSSQDSASHRHTDPRSNVDDTTQTSIQIQSQTAQQSQATTTKVLSLSEARKQRRKARRTLPLTHSDEHLISSPSSTRLAIVHGRESTSASNSSGRGGVGSNDDPESVRRRKRDAPLRRVRQTAADHILTSKTERVPSRLSHRRADSRRKGVGKVATTDDGLRGEAGEDDGLLSPHSQHSLSMHSNISLPQVTPAELKNAFRKTDSSLWRNVASPSHRESNVPDAASEPSMAATKNGVTLRISIGDHGAEKEGEGCNVTSEIEGGREEQISREGLIDQKRLTDSQDQVHLVIDENMMTPAATLRRRETVLNQAVIRSHKDGALILEESPTKAHILLPSLLNEHRTRSLRNGPTGRDPKCITDWCAAAATATATTAAAPAVTTSSIFTDVNTAQYASNTEKGVIVDIAAAEVSTTEDKISILQLAHHHHHSNKIELSALINPSSSPIASYHPIGNINKGKISNNADDFSSKGRF